MTALAMVALAGAIALAETKESPTMLHASGTFDVKVTPVALEGPVADETLGRFVLDKRYHGALEATGFGQMLTAGRPDQGSAGYVAIERVEGTLDGRKGSFALQHFGTMTPAGQDLRILVVPGSGGGELAGISGSCTIRIEGKQHFYDLEYALAGHP